MVQIGELREAVDAAFERTSRDTPTWPDPRTGRSHPPDDAYSRVSDPGKWLILAARADAWMIALVDAGVAVVQSDDAITWTTNELPVIPRTERISPVTAGALDLVIGHSRLGGVDDAGLVVGVGNPAECVTWIPFCGCDACDAGSQHELDHLDGYLTGIVTGTFRKLTKRDQSIVTIDGVARITHGLSSRAQRNVAAVLARPHGWDELSGRSWLPAPT